MRYHIHKIVYHTSDLCLLFIVLVPHKHGVFFEAESGCCMRQCCGPARGFVMHITDNYNQVRIYQSCAVCDSNSKRLICF